MSFRLIVGLGNPGEKYRGTRHNIGFEIIDTFARRLKVDAWSKDRKLKSELTAIAMADSKVILCKPQTYMNESGVAVQKVCSFHKIPPEAVLVIFDELNLPVGRSKLSLTGSAGGHNGVASLLDFLPPRFARFRVGIGQKKVPEMDLADHVLGKFDPEETTLIADSMDFYCESLERLLREPAQLAMNHINRQRKSDDSNSI